MFTKLIGNYLVKNDKLSQAQFDEVIKKQQASRVKLGLIAVSEKMITIAQADKINQLQSTMDKRFGDIAVEQGFLTDEQVTTLLGLQGNSYLKFIQTLVDDGYLTMEQIDEVINNIKDENKFSPEDIESLKSGDIDRIIAVFIKTDNELYDDFMGLAIRNLIRFIDSELTFSVPYRTSAYSSTSIATQCIKGDYNIFVGISGKDNNLLAVANPYIKPYGGIEFDEVDEDAFDAICEFINCVNGLYATSLSTKNVDIDMLPPLSYNDVSVTSEKEFYVLPVNLHGKDIDVLVGIDSSIMIQ